MKPLRRVSTNENDPDYCPWLGCNDGMGEFEVYLAGAPNAKIYFEAVDQENRTATIFVYTYDGTSVNPKGVSIGDECLKATITNVAITIEMTQARREEIEYWFATQKGTD